jgi:VWFA-related protein
MRSSVLHFKRLCSLALLCLCALLSTAHAQQNSRPAQQEQDVDVVRINTELVQTDVMVFDKNGRFVDGLKPDQFELRVDGKPQTISFFERVTAGSASEEAQLAAARGAISATSNESDVKPLDRGRTVFFYVDDIHLSIESLRRTRQTLLHFINDEMKQNDQVAIISATGQIGFLQQLTDNRTVLRAAVARLSTPRQPVRDSQQPPMSESMALAIETERDPQLLDFFVSPLIRDGLSREAAENMVKARATQLLEQSSFFTRNTLTGLEGLARRASALPGRKLVFFISDGFILNLRRSEIMDSLRNITNAAARNSVVIYTMDARGLAVSSLTDSTTQGTFDPSGRTVGYLASDISDTQEPLRTIAANTGGRALLNSNNSNIIITRALAETSVYYLLAWRPEGEARGNKFRRIEVGVRGRSDLTVNVRGGYYDMATKQSAKHNQAETKPAAHKTPDTDLGEAIRAPYPVAALPTQLDLVYLDVPDKGLVLTVSMQVVGQFLTFEQAGDKQTGEVDIAGLVFNDQGKLAASFSDHLNLSVNASAISNAPKANIVYNYQAHLPPGLYQVRVAAHDNKSSRTGSAMQWIEIPDLSSHRFSLSSLLLGEITKRAMSLLNDPQALATPRTSVDHHFAQSSRLRFLTFIYNAARGTTNDAPPDLALQIQILRDDQPVVTTPLRKVATEGATDLARLAYAAEISLDGMLPGRYVLQVTIIDRIAKTSASQHTNFEIE